MKNIQQFIKLNAYMIKVCKCQQVHSVHSLVFFSFFYSESFRFPVLGVCSGGCGACS